MVGNRAEGGTGREPFAGYRALACDGDGTLTYRGRMAATTRRALESLRASGRQLILVTGETLKELALCCDQVVGVGDAENDQALLRCCGCGAVPGNAVLTARRCADLVLPGRGAQGVVNLIHRLLEGDLPAPKRGRRPKQ